MKTVAIDFDGTMFYGEDEAKEITAWRSIIRSIQSAGLFVIIATMRASGNPDNDRIIRFLGSLSVPVVYCWGYPDKNTACYAAGYPVDIWVDDAPEVCRMIPYVCKSCGAVEEPA